MAFYCSSCGSSLPTGARFCSSCGTSVGAAVPMPGRPLVRPIIGRQIAGVCIGVAQANGWDISLIRVLAVIGFFFSGGLVAVAYLAGWIGIPEQLVTTAVAYPPNVYPPQV